MVRCGSVGALSRNSEEWTSSSFQRRHVFSRVRGTALSSMRGSWFLLACVGRRPVHKAAAHDIQIRVGVRD